MSGATLLAVCVVHEVIPDPGGSMGITAIDKRPRDGVARLDANGVVGDRQMDRVHHGGVDKAVYAYAEEDRNWWAEQLGRKIPAGTFGENLVTQGLDVTGAVIGERWNIGAAVVEVSMPREPCATFQRWTGESQWVKRFTEAGRPGAYLRVVSDGEISPGDTITVVGRPDHGVTIGDVFAGRRGDADALRRLLANGTDLAPSLVATVERELRVTG